MKVYCVVATAKWYEQVKEGTGTRSVRHRMYLGQQYDVSAETVKYLGDKVSKVQPRVAKEAVEAAENKQAAAAGENKSGN